MEKRIKEVMASVFSISELAIDDNTAAQTVESWDSLNHMNLIIALEEEFGVEFDTKEIVSMVSYRSICLNISKKLDKAL